MSSSSSTNSNDQRPLKYCEGLHELNFRRYVDKYLLDAKAVALCQKAKISGTQLSLFRSGRGGMEWHSFIRMIIGMGCKIVDPQGNTILGNPEKFDQEISDNTAVFVEEQEGPAAKTE